MLLGAAGGAAPGTPEAEWNALEGWIGLYTPDLSLSALAQQNHGLTEQTALIRVEATLPALLSDVGCLAEIGGTSIGFAFGESSDGAPGDLYFGCGSANGDYANNGGSWGTLDLSPGDLGQQIVAWFYGYSDPGDLVRLIAWVSRAGAGYTRHDCTAATAAQAGGLWGTDACGYLNVSDGGLRAGVPDAISSASPASGGFRIWVDPVLPAGVDFANANAP